VGSGQEDKRQTITLGVGEQISGSAESENKLLASMLEELNEVGRRAYPDRQPIKLSDVGGSATDHQQTEMKSNALIEEERQRQSPGATKLVPLQCWNHK
jgi:hypothetical protein